LEVKLAAAESGVNPRSPIVIDDFDWGDDDAAPQHGFKLKGDRTLAFKVLVALGKSCGQLFFFPDTGEPSMVVEPWTNGDFLADLHRQASLRDDGGQWIYLRLFGDK
jgi:hypothetical protein